MDSIFNSVLLKSHLINHQFLQIWIMNPFFRYACFALLFCSFFTAGAQEIWEGQKAENFLAGSELIRFKEGHKTPDFFRFRQGHERPLSEANALLNKLLAVNENTRWKEVKHEKDELGFEHITYHQFNGDVQVEFSFYRLHVKQGRIVSGNGQWYSNLPNSTVSAISPAQAIQAAMNSIQASSYKWENPLEEAWLKWELNQQGASYYPNPTLVFAPASPELNKSELRLAYKLDVYASEPLSRHDVFVDALSGEVLWKVNKIHTADSNGTANTVYSGNRPMVADYFNGSYRLRETGRGNGIQTFDLNNGTNYGSAVDFTDADNIWNNINASLDQYAGDAHWGAEMTYDYFMLIHNRNSIDGNGFMLRSYLHYSNNYNNAFWDGQRMTYGDGDGSVFTPLTALDICAHEVSHGLTSNTAALVYQNESGALNESFSDIFGMAVTAYANNVLEWTIGEDATPNGNGIRSMSNPNAFGDPDTYSGTNYYTGTQDNGGVHTNSGVQNFWFYLLTIGGNGTNDLGSAYTVNGIGVVNAAKVAFRNLTVYLGPNSDHQDARFYAIQSAIDLFGPCTPEVISTTNAWYAVGVGSVFNSAVIAAFTAPMTSFCQAPAMVNFNNTSTNAGTFIWNFGDGNTSTAVNPTHTYQTSGNFNVSLIANGGACGMDTLIQNAYITLDTTLPCSITMNPNGLNQTQFSCSGTLFDPGGINNNYPDNLSSVITIAPTGAATVTLNFTAFDTEAGYDYLFVYDGSTTNAPLIGQFSGTNLPNGGTITSSTGAITIKMTADPFVTGAGFVCNWSCSMPTTPPSADFLATSLVSCDGMIHFTDQTTNGAVTWAWDFGDGTTSVLQNPSHDYQTDGTYSVKLVATNFIGSDSIVKINHITIDRPDVPQTSGNISVCVPDSALLIASATDEIRWYSAQNATTPIYSGDSLQIYIAATDTFWVEHVENQPVLNVGSVNSAANGGYHNNSTIQYLIFNVLQPVSLNSVWVNANGAGNRTIMLWDAAGNLIDSRFISIPGGQSRIALNFNLQPGTGYRLGGSDMSLYRNNANVTYPYTSAGLVSITGSSAGNNFYYYYYDWEIQAKPCISPRVPIITSLDSVVASFTQTSQGLSVNFASTSIGASAYLWNFGDGNASTQQNPSHTYSQPGTYFPTLIAFHQGCSDTTGQSVTVQSMNLISNSGSIFEAYPIPFTNSLFLNWNSKAQIDTWTLLDLTGRTINQYKASSQTPQEIQGLENLNSGIYFIRAVGTQGQSLGQQRLIKWQ